MDVEKQSSYWAFVFVGGGNATCAAFYPRLEGQTQHTQHFIKQNDGMNE